MPSRHASEHFLKIAINPDFYSVACHKFLQEINMFVFLKIKNKIKLYLPNQYFSDVTLNKQLFSKTLGNN